MYFKPPLDHSKLPRYDELQEFHDLNPPGQHYMVIKTRKDRTDYQMQRAIRQFVQGYENTEDKVIRVKFGVIETGSFKMDDFDYAIGFQRLLNQITRDIDVFDPTRHTEVITTGGISVLWLNAEWLLSGQYYSPISYAKDSMLYQYRRQNYAILDLEKKLRPEFFYQIGIHDYAYEVEETDRTLLLKFKESMEDWDKSWLKGGSRAHLLHK